MPKDARFVDEHYSRFVDEIKILLNISHPNIVRIYNYYLYPEAEGSDDLQLCMNSGSTYEANVMPRDDISVTKHGLKIPMDACNYAKFVAEMRTYEQEFVREFSF